MIAIIVVQNTYLHHHRLFVPSLLYTPSTLPLGRTRGFTLIELMISVLILITLALLSCSPLSSFFYSYSVSSEGMRVFHTLQFARTQAIKRNKMVYVCGSHDLIHCSSNWTNGYMVYTTTSNKNSSKTKQLLRVEKNIHHTQIHSKGQKKIRFTSDGLSFTRASIYMNHQAKALKIVIYDSGRIRIEYPEASGLN